jgi:hypothetical protein
VIDLDPGEVFDIYGFVDVADNQVRPNRAGLRGRYPSIDGLVSTHPEATIRYDEPTINELLRLGIFNHGEGAALVVDSEDPAAAFLCDGIIFLGGVRIENATVVGIQNCALIDTNDGTRRRGSLDVIGRVSAILDVRRSRIVHAFPGVGIHLLEGSSVGGLVAESVLFHVAAGGVGVDASAGSAVELADVVRCSFQGAGAAVRGDVSDWSFYRCRGL